MSPPTLSTNSGNAFINGSFTQPGHLLSSLEDHVANESQKAAPTRSPLTLCSAPELPTLSSAHIQDHKSNIFVPLYGSGYQRYEASETTTPSVGSPDSDRKSFVDIDSRPSIDPDVLENFNWRISSGYFAYFLCGWGEGIMATILPHFMSDFNITFMTGSLFYAASTIGFLVGTGLLEKILSHLGRIRRSRDRRSWFPFISIFPKSSQTATRFSSLQARHLAIMFSSLLHGMFFLVMGTRGGFPAIFMAYTIAAFARAIMTGPLNEYFAIVPKHLGYAFAFWSFGSVVSPLVCQAVISRGVPWFQFFFGSLVASALNVTFLTISFRPTALEFARERRDADRDCIKASSPITMEDKTNKDEMNRVAIQPPSTLRLALSQPFLWVISIFAGIYYASETISQGFMVSYLLETRNADPKTAGYVTSGFFAGIMIGRLVWGYYTERLSTIRRKYIVEACILIGLVMHLLIWFIRSVATDSVALAFIGLFYGPIFPACLNLANGLLSPDIRMVSMALISSAASLGCAILPFAVGIILNQKGARALPYTNVALAGVLACFWVCLPSKRRIACEDGKA